MARREDETANLERILAGNPTVAERALLDELREAIRDAHRVHDLLARALAEPFTVEDTGLLVEACTILECGLLRLGIQP